ncbi:hypothetical protein ACJJTC_008226 [Scirpophaga incertulas]
MPFVLGSRYGRSPQRLITARNDRFFMGSRYGKRSGLRVGFARPGMRAAATLHSGDKLATTIRQLDSKFGIDTGDDMGQPDTRMGFASKPGRDRSGMDTALPLECAPTQTFSLYRCVPAHTALYFRPYRRAEEWSAGGPRAD